MATLAAPVASQSVRRVSPAIECRRGGDGCVAVRSARRCSHSIQVPEALEEDQGNLIRPALFNRTGQQIARALQIPRLVRSDTLMKTLFRFALTFGQRAPGALDVGTCPPVTPLEEGHSRPHVDRLLVVAAEVLIETRQ